MKRTLFSVIFLSFLFLLTSCTEKAEEHKCCEEEGVTKKIEQTYDVIEDRGTLPDVFDIEKLTLSNANYRMATWTGEYMQLVFMSLKPGEIIDLEVHHDHDQFFRIEKGEGVIKMGLSKENLDFKEVVKEDWAIMVPAGYWHKLRNTGDIDLKLYTIYAPVEHARGTVHKTYRDAAEYEHSH